MIVLVAIFVLREGLGCSVGITKQNPELAVSSQKQIAEIESLLILILEHGSIEVSWGTRRIELLVCISS